MMLGYIMVIFVAFISLFIVLSLFYILFSGIRDEIKTTKKKTKVNGSQRKKSISDPPY